MADKNKPKVLDTNKEKPWGELTPFNNILPATPLAGRPNYDPDLNRRVEWETGRGPSKPVKPVPNTPSTPKK